MAITKGLFARAPSPAVKVTSTPVPKQANFGRKAREWSKAKKTEGRADRLYPQSKG